MSEVTYFSDGTIRLSVGEDITYATLTHDDIEKMIEHLRFLGYIVIEANHVQYCHYVSGQCPHCGRPAQGSNS